MKINELMGVNALAFKPDKSNRWQDLFGIELELENCRTAAIDNWVVHDDQSLRNQGVEYVTYTPMGGELLATALDSFYSAKLKYTAGSRTSTHIHVNMTDTTLDHLRAMLCIVYAIEDALFNVVGESRKWTGYAMPLSEMDPVRLRGIMAEADTRQLIAHLAPSRNAERYYACNTAALRRFGSLEFRYFPGGPSRQELESWLDLVANLKKNTAKLTVNDLVSVENSSAFISLLLDVIGRDWTMRLFGASNANEMFDKFTEVVAMAEGDTTPDRRERLVFLNPMLIGFVSDKLLKDEAKIKWFKEQVEPLKVVSQNDFIWYVRNARVQGDVNAGRFVNPYDEPIVGGSFADAVLNRPRRTAPIRRPRLNAEGMVVYDEEAPTPQEWPDPSPASDPFDDE